MKQSTYAAVLRNFIIIATGINGILSLFVYAVLPMDVVMSGANILSLLANQAAGRWLRIWIVVDAISVLLAGVLSGVLSACGLIGRLAQ
jgi:hypothetical protein